MTDMPSFGSEAGRLCHNLRRIVASNKMSRARRDRAEGFLRRLETPVSVWLLGPDPQATALLCRGLLPLAADPFVTLHGHDGPLDTRCIPFDSIDIAIWCSPEFGPAEEAIWSAAPERLMDHSVLVCLGDKQVQSDLFDAVRSLSLDDPDAAFRALSDMLLTRVRDGLRAQSEAAHVLIDSCELPPETAHAPPSPASEKSTQEISTLAPTAPETAQQHRPSHQDARSLHDKTACTLHDHTCTLHDIDLGTDAAASVVLSSCETLCVNLADLLGAAAPEDIPQHLLDAVQDAHDAILLMGLEGGLRAATDAVTTLIQIRKEFALGCAA